MPSSKGPTDNRREAAKERMARAMRDGDDATVTEMIREANTLRDWRAEEAELDRAARDAHVRAEHEATHGEAEMCGAECIALGLVDFDDEDDAPDPEETADAGRRVRAYLGTLPSLPQPFSLEHSRGSSAELTETETSAQVVDVDRLEKAWVAHCSKRFHGSLSARGVAEDIAAEYARLAPLAEQKPGRWAFLDTETGDWIEVQPGVVWGAAPARNLG